MLAVASILDMKYREIPDKVWAIFAGVGGLVLLLEMTDASSPMRQAGLTTFLLKYSLGIAVISGIGYATYKTGLFGGADPKALVAIAIILPVFDSPFRLHDFTAVTVLTNALIISMSAMLFNVIKNTVSMARGIRIFDGIAEGKMKKALAFAVGFYANSSGKFVFAMEERDENGQKRLRFNPFYYDEFENNAGKMWVTQALPFIIYIGIGFAITFIVGDLLALLISSIF
jgi:preflagellin peptidase FlaK